MTDSIGGFLFISEICWRIALRIKVNDKDFLALHFKLWFFGDILYCNFYKSLLANKIIAQFPESFGRYIKITDDIFLEYK